MADTSESVQKQKVTKATSEPGATSESGNGIVSIPSKLEDISFRQPEASTSDSPIVRHAQPLSSPSKKDAIKGEADEVKQGKMENVEVVTVDESDAAAETLEEGVERKTPLQQLLEEINRPAKKEEVPSDSHKQSQEMGTDAQEQQNSLAQTAATQQASQVPGAITQSTPMAYLPQVLPFATAQIPFDDGNSLQGMGADAVQQQDGLAPTGAEQLAQLTGMMLQPISMAYFPQAGPSATVQMPLGDGNLSQGMDIDTGQQPDGLGPTEDEQQLLQIPGIVIQPIPVAYVPVAVPIQPRYLRRDEYLSAVIASTQEDFSNPPNPAMQDAFACQDYDKLLDYAKALDHTGQISTAQEVIILAIAKCFRRLGTYQEVDKDFELIANILKQGHALAHGALLRILRLMLERFPAAFVPRGEAFIPIFDGFAAVVESYSQVIPHVAQSRAGALDNSTEVLRKWRVTRQNTGQAMRILQWIARQAAHWACMNGSRALLITLSSLVTDPVVDREIHEMIIEYMSFNQAFLPAVDNWFPQNVVLDTVISMYEHAAGYEISSLQYPEYMGMLQLSELEATGRLSIPLKILYQYSKAITRESVVLARFVGLLTKVVLRRDYRNFRDEDRRKVCGAMKQLFQRFPDEFDVTRDLVLALGSFLADRVCSNDAFYMLTTIRIHSQIHSRSEGTTS